MPTRFAAYARVSTSEQAERGKSIEDQLAKLGREAKSRGGTLVKTFADPGCSGSTLKRPQLAALLAFCREGGADAVLVVDTDRLARKTEHHFAIKAQLRKCNVRVESLNQPMIDDTPEGVFLDTILAATNALYPQITGRKTSLSMAEKAAAGWWPGPARLGYRNADNPIPTSANDRRILVPHETKGPLVTQAFSLYAGGKYSLQSLCAEMEARGLRSVTGGRVTKTTMRKMLGDPFYIGKAPYKGEVRQWKHTPLTDEATFTRCRLVLEAHNRYADRMRKHTFLLSGLVTCGLCGAPYTASVNPRKKKSYYHCPLNRAGHSNAGQNVSVEALDAEAARLLGCVSFNAPSVEQIVLRAREIVAVTHGELDGKRRELASQKALLENRRSRLEAAFLDGDIAAEAYRRQAKTIEEQLIQLSLELARLDLSRETNIGQFEQLMRLSTDFGAAYEAAGPELRRRYLSLCFEEIVVRDRRVVQVTPTAAFAVVLDKSRLDEADIRCRLDHYASDHAGDESYNRGETKTAPRLHNSDSQQVKGAVIKSRGWLPDPSEFITLLRDVGYWDGVRNLLIEPAAVDQVSALGLALGVMA